MPSLPFEYHEEAIREAHHAFHWHHKQSEEVGDRFWEELTRARRLVCSTPDRWTPYYHGTRVFRRSRFPYGLVYSVEDEVIIGWAVIHFKQRPGYWAERRTS